MIQKDYIEDLSKHVGEEVTLRGWLSNKRSSGKIQFLILRDGTGLCQCVVMKNAVDAETYALADSLAQESTFAVSGKVQEAKGKAPGDVEVFVSKLEAISTATEYPITPKEHGIEYLMEHRHLWLRHSRPWATMRVRDTIIVAIRNFFHERGFICFDAPILTPNAAEGTSTLFETEYFDEGMAYLSQSGQLYGEAGAMAFGKVYVFGPTFRAERSKTKRHLNEFWMVEPEVAFMDLEGDMELAEDFVHEVIARVLKDREAELAILDDGTGTLKARCEKVLKPFMRMHYDEASKILDKYWDEKLASGEELPPTFKRFEYGDDFGAYDEVALTSLYDQPVIVHHYPASVKAFYMKRDPNEPDKALAMDVLFPEFGEIIGGSQREDDLDLLLQRIEEHNLPQSVFEWYLDLRRYGSVPHAGFGLGLERLVMWVCGLEHIREAIPFPRTLTRIWP
ncbi:MAG TPA: asparagine--tRNA ligase [Candidatus Kapabacteria bacterium]|nr:asparagine--tRNA ligase [Candidatus Kapabacteria bacterium]